MTIPWDIIDLLMPLLADKQSVNIIRSRAFSSPGVWSSSSRFPFFFSFLLSLFHFIKLIHPPPCRPIPPFSSLTSPQLFAMLSRLISFIMYMLAIIVTRRDIQFATFSRP